MESREAILMLIGEKNQQLISYEELTRSLTDCGLDDMKSLMMQRRAAADALDQLDHQLNLLCRDAIDQKRMLRSALSNTCERDALPCPFKEVFDASQKGYMILNRIKNLESLILARLERQKEDAALNIKAGSNTAKIVRYRSANDSQGENSVLLKQKYRKA